MPDAKGAAMEWRLDRYSVAAGLVLLAALAAAGLGLRALDERVTGRVGPLTLADPTPELVARYGLHQLVRQGLAYGPDGEEPLSWEAPVGPIVVHVRPEAARLGFGAIREGDWFVFVGGTQPRSVMEVKRALTDELKRNPSAHDVSCRYVYGPGDATRPGWGSTGTLDATALTRPSWRSHFVSGEVSDGPIVGAGFLLELSLLLAALTVVEWKRPEHPWLRGFLLALGAIVFAAEVGAIALLADATL